jgi:hypothetical protein
MPRGPFTWAALAGPPSPEESDTGFVGGWALAAALAAATSPAMVEIVPVAPSTLRTRLLSLSAM